jgi:hypothetical protein
MSTTLKGVNDMYFPLLLSPTLWYDTDIATCNYLIMQNLPNNESSEGFGTLPKDSETFGIFPNASERKENHILTVHIAARKFEDAGVPRTERSITNWCQPDRNSVSRLDCYFDPNERKYYITPQSVERAIEEEKSKIKTGGLPHASESVGSFPNSSEAFRTVPHASETTANERPANHHNESENLPPDLAEELEELRIEKRAWERERKFYDKWFASLEKQQESVLPQIAELSRTVGYLEARNESLEKENQRLLTSPMKNAERFIEQIPHEEDESPKDISRGETADVVTE